MSLPSVETVRQRIEHAHPTQAKYTLMAAYLFCARASEIISRTCPSDLVKTQARGPTGKDVKTDTYQLGPIKTETAIFTVKTAKREGKPRNIALPLDPDYEPFTKELLAYFQKFDNAPVFPITRQKAYEYATKTFEGLTYPIESYNLYENGTIKQTIKFHNKPFKTHALRHLRATELIENYGFTGIDLSTYGGWTLRSTIGVGSAMSRYAHLNWQSYFPKLLKPRN